jgi:carbamoyl-phosphate synthase large subunit
MLGETLKEMGYSTGLYPNQPNIAVKAPVFSFSKLIQVDIGLGPEMKSTGEILGVDTEFSRSLYKAMIASGVDVPLDGSMIVTVADKDKEEAPPIIEKFVELGFTIYATEGTARFLSSHKIPAQQVFKISEEGSPNMMELIRTGKVDLLINTISKDKQIEREGALIRRAAVEHNIPCLTSLDTAKALLKALNSQKKGEDLKAKTIDEYLKGSPGLAG